MLGVTLMPSAVFASKLVIVQPGVSTQTVIAFSVSGCTPVTPTTGTLTTSPQHGTVAFTNQTFSLPSCPGVSFPGVAANYTWTASSVTPGSASDVFHVHFASSVGAVEQDVFIALNAAGKELGSPGRGGQSFPQSCSACTDSGQGIDDAPTWPSFGGATDADGSSSFWGSKIASGSPSTSGIAEVGGPIEVGSGNVFYSHTDYTTAGQNPLAFTRYYNSKGRVDSFAALIATVAVNRNWRSNFDRYIDILTATVVGVERPDGRVLSFYLTGGVWTPDTDVDFSLTHSGATWTLTTPSGSVETYTTTALGNSATLNTIVARNGYTQTMNYTGGLLASVTDSYGRALSFTRNTDRSIASVTTPDATAITYAYNSIASGQQLTSVTFPTAPAQTITYVYGNASLPFALTGVTDENGNAYERWTYDSSGRGLTNQQGNGATLTTLTYGSGTTTVTNALGVTDTYTLTVLQGVPKVTAISRAATSTTAGATETFTYDANGFLASVKDWNGNTTSYTRNTHGMPTSFTEAAGTSSARTVTITYNASFPRLPATVASPGVTMAFTYDTSGNVLTTAFTDTTTNSVPYSTNGQKRTWTNTWTNHLLATRKTPSGNLTTFGHASDAALISITDALGHAVTVTSHTGGGRPLTVVDANAVTTTLTYDPRQRLLTRALSTSGGTRTTTYGYDAAGNLTRTTLADGSFVANAFDAAHRLTQMTNGVSEQLVYTLDALGDRTSAKTFDATPTLWRSTGATFDALGRQLTYVGGEGQTTTWTYDSNGNALTVKDGAGNLTTRAFDALDRLHTVTDALGGVTTYSYDAHDRVTSVQDANGHTTSYVYDGFGDLIQQASPDTGTTVYRYDAHGNLTQQTDAASVVTNQTFDALDRLTSRTHPTDGSQDAHFTYDQTGFPYALGVGRLTSFTDGSGFVALGYDERGNVSFKRRTYNAVNYDIWPSYDAAGRYNGVAYPSGIWAGYGRDGAGQINQAVVFDTSGHGPTTVEWPAYGPFFGPVRYQTAGNGVHVAKQLDGDYRIGTFRVTTALGDLTNQGYFHDNADNVGSVVDTIATANAQTLNYDGLNRLISASSGAGGYGSLAWAYDKVGNLASRTVGSVTTTYGYASGTNRLSSVGGTSVTTDSVGNIASIPPAVGGGASTFTYNIAHRLASVSGGGATAASYQYGVLGERVAKTVGGVTTLFITGINGELLEERNLSTGAVQDYLYSNSLLAGLYNPASNTLTYVHTDRLGAPAFITDTLQSVVWSVAHDPYDTTVNLSGSLTNNIRLPGQYADSETGFSQNGFRDYMPNLGRYLEADPIGLGGGINPYAYAGGNPIKFTDRWGLVPGTVTSGMGCLLGVCLGLSATDHIDGSPGHWYLQSGFSPTWIDASLGTMLSNDPDGYSTEWSLQRSLSTGPRKLVDITRPP